MDNNSYWQPNKKQAFHDPYSLNKGLLFNSIIFLGVFLLLSLVVVSFIFEVVAALQIFAIAPAVTIALVLAFNIFKMLVPFFITASKAVNQRKITILPHIIRMMLIIFSALMTLLLLTTWLSAPNAERVKASDLIAIKKNYQEQIQFINDKELSANNVINSEFEISTELIKSLAITDSKTLTDNITTEAKNVVHGESDGPRLATLQKVKKAEVNYILNSLSELMSKKTALLETSRLQIDVERTLLINNYQASQSRILQKDYHDDDRSKLTIILDLKRALNKFSLDLEYISIVWFFSLLVTVMLEALIIYLSSWLGNTYKKGMERYIKRKEYMEEAALMNVTKSTNFSAKAHQAKQEAKHSMEDIYDEMEATSKTFI